MSKRQAALVGSLVVLLCSGAVSAVGVEPSTAAIEPAAIGGQSQGVTEISQCTTIDEPGRYVLTRDITDSGARFCIRITASDVVLDGRGHTLDARDVDQKTEAVAAGYTDPSIENITIKNLVVTDWVQGVGCSKIANGVTIRNVTAKRNGFTEPPGPSGGYGIYVGEYTNVVTVEDNIAVNNSIGISLGETNDTVVRGNVVRSNSQVGIRFAPKTWNNSVVENRVISNRRGIRLGRTNDTVIRGNIVRNNSEDGLLLSTAWNNTIVENQVISNRRGIKFSESNNTKIRGNVIRHNERGVMVTQSNDTKIHGNVVRENEQSGILLSNSHTNRIVENQVTTNSVGVTVKRGNDTSIRMNRLVENEVGVSIVEEASHVTVNANRIENSSQTSIVVGVEPRDIVITNNFLSLPRTEQVGIQLERPEHVTSRNNTIQSTTETPNTIQTTTETPDTIQTTTETPGQPGFGAVIAIISIALLTYRYAHDLT